jgi:endonuclease III
VGVPLARVVARPFEEAKKTLKRFPGVAEAGAERIALFAGAHPRLGLESNGLRVLVRLGFAHEHKSWDRTWREASLAAHAELPRDVRALMRAHLLLRRHGQELCKRTRPLCHECPLASRCPASNAEERAAKPPRRQEQRKTS